MALFNGIKAADHVKSLQAAQDLLAAVETVKGRLNTAFSDKTIEKGFYQELRILAQQMESSLRDFALHHERLYERSEGFFNKNKNEYKGTLRGVVRD